MTAKRSAAIALVRGAPPEREVLLVHPGGPFWTHKDEGAWSLPKGLIEADEAPLVAALREFREELGHEPPPGPYVDLGDVVQKSGKRVRAFAVCGDLDVTSIRSNEVELEYPTDSGRRLRFPEVDRALWASRELAGRLINAAQLPLVDRALATDFAGKSSTGE